MLTLEAGSLEAQSRRGRKRRWEVSYRKRYWNIETQAFVFETPYTEVKRGEVESVSDVREALDRSGVGEFRASNVTIELRNVGNSWSDRNPGGRFAADSTARLGYVRQLMEFRVRGFYEFEDGTESQPVPYFSGLASEWDGLPDKGTVQITLVSRHELLRRGNAENVSTARTNITLVGAVDGVNKVFVTPENGIGRFKEVRKTSGGVTAVQRQGIDVAVSDLSRHDLPGKITFATAPAVGSVVKADYTEWLKDKKIEELASLVAVEAGIPITEQDVEPVVYTNRVINTRTFTTQAEWQGGSLLQNIDTTGAVGDIRKNWNPIDHFDDLEFALNPTWAVKSAGSGISAATGKLKPTAGGTAATLSLPWSKNTGTWRFKLKSAATLHVYFFLDRDTVSGSGLPNGFGYFMEWTSSTVSFWRLDGDPTSPLLLASFAGTITGVEDEWRVSRTSAGFWVVRQNGTLQTSFTENTYSTATHFLVEQKAGGPSEFDELAYSNIVDNTSSYTSAASVWDGPAIDGTIDFGEWLSTVHVTNLPGGTSVLVETATADESFPGSGVPGAFDAYVAVSDGGLVRSVQRRFLKLRLNLNTVGSPENFPAIETPTTASASVLFTTSTTRIKLANFTNMTCLAAMSDLGVIASYEWNFSRTSRLFFRPRTFDGVADFTVRLRSGAKFRRVSDGEDRVFNRILASYGTHEKVVDPLTSSDSRPNSFDHHGVKTLPVGSTQILVDPDADIATGLAISYLGLFKNPRRRFELDVDGLPQVEMSDTGRLMWADALPNPPWHIGDSSRAIGDTDIGLFGHEQQSAFDIMARVISTSHSALADKTRLELEEIL